ncbi:MAG: hypothetical protein M1569_00875 [Candidatus Marsarchaeota archaeon]|nr:hypothetical protein [Candidatus Marsarchaeota archaeon]
MNVKQIAYLAVSLMVPFLLFLSAATFGIFGTAIALFSLITVAIIFMLAFADYIIFPLFTRLLNIIIIPSKDCVITKGQDSIVKYTKGIYYATGYITASVYNYVFAEEQQVNDQDELVAAPDKWEKATMNMDFPFKFNLIVTGEDVQKFRDELESKRGLLEFQYSRESDTSAPNVMELENIQRQIRVLQAKIDKLGAGLKPLNSLIYLESIAVGVSEKDATDKLAGQLDQMQTVFNIFNLSMARVVGRELYLLYRLNYALPGIAELEEEFQIQR